MTVTYNCEGNGEVHLDVLKAICGDVAGKSMIDLCAGFAPQTRRIRFDDRLYVDSVYRDLAEESGNFIHVDLFAYIRYIRYVLPEKVNCCFLLDAIEHFKKEDGCKILEWMVNNSEKNIVFTPLGDYIIETTETNNPDSHKSGWLPNDFNGWATIVFPNFHKLLNIGAFFAFSSDYLEQDFERVINELNQKEWAK